MQPATNRPTVSQRRRTADGIAFWVRIVLVALAAVILVAAIFDSKTVSEPMELSCNPVEGETTKLTCTATEENPAGQLTGAYAALIAIFASGMALSKAAAMSRKRRLWCDILVSVSIMASAYLWVAAETGTHPKDPTLSLSLLMLVAATALVVGLTLLPWIIAGCLDWLSRMCSRSNKP